ncbi:MAG TPA: ribosomal protein S18-alanine N-acetyltransferase [Gemmatimonadaceae bacterium]|nr:ribosomal protein S18-alanine N-acetyltransferase [Gemmatimonadaceae bacterium]
MRGERDIVQPITIRPAAASDLDAIVAIEGLAFSDPWSRATFASLIGEPLVHFAVAEFEGAVLGYVVAWFIAGDCEIGNLAVHAAQRGRRIGGRLLDSALAEARARGTESVYLEVRESNVVAQRMYGARGFARVGRRRRYYRRPEEDAYILHLVMHPQPGDQHHRR